MSFVATNDGFHISVADTFLNAENKKEEQHVLNTSNAGSLVSSDVSLEDFFFLNGLHLSKTWAKHARTASLLLYSKQMETCPSTGPCSRKEVLK